MTIAYIYVHFQFRSFGNVAAVLAREESPGEEEEQVVNIRYVLAVNKLPFNSGARAGFAM